MTPQTAILIAAFALFAGVAFGYVLRWVISLGKKGSMELQVKQILLEAKDGAQKIVEEAEKKSKNLLEESRTEAKQQEEKHLRSEDRLIKKEDLLDKRQQEIDKEVEHIKRKIEEIKSIREHVEQIETTKKAELEKVSGLTINDAKEELLKRVEKEYEEDLVVRINKIEHQTNDAVERKAKDILTTAIHRLANSMPSDVMATTVSIPSDEVKGKIIGKEGRNIKALERATGVEIIVDDTPGVITLSSYDPVRRQIARVALENLILDGRIQPAKIEEEVAKAKEEISKIIKQKGEQAAYECGVFNLDPRITTILGRLFFRTSYGQNVLEHSIEMSHIAGMIAEELGADIPIAKAGALLHDIGKAVDHEVAGTHVEIGRRILQKFGADERIIKAMQAHHGEYPYETVESILVQVADAISGGRPGARRDTVENYLKRLSDLEGIATSFEGVEKAYALQAGREIRVFVTPAKITDLEAREIARNIALQIENELKYPGEIKVNVIRESRVIEFAR